MTTPQNLLNAATELAHRRQQIIAELEEHRRLHGLPLPVEVIVEIELIGACVDLRTGAVLATCDYPC